MRIKISEKKLQVNYTKNACLLMSKVKKIQSPKVKSLRCDIFLFL